MNLSINIAGRRIRINFLGEAERVVPLLTQFFRDFLCRDERAEARIVISLLKKGKKGLPQGLDRRKRIIEQRLPIKDVTEWLKGLPGPGDDFRLDNETVACYGLGGLLLFNPEDSSGHIYLLREGPDRFMPLFRLFWVYFAQVLGESRSCFIHSAALVRDKRGYLFLGDSGAGKSTLARASGGSTLLSDDSPVLSKLKGDYCVFPSPFHQIDPVTGLGREAAGTSARLEGIYFLFKDRQLFREEVSREEAVSMIVRRHILFLSYLTRRARIQLLDLVLGVCERVPLYNLHYSPDKDLWGAVLDR